MIIFKYQTVTVSCCQKKERNIMYIIDFFKNLFRKNNIGVIIWLLANTVLLVALFSGGFTDLGGAFLGLGLYLLSLMIALSPVGEWILRLQNGCKKITDPAVLARIEPLFQQAYAKAKKLTPELPDNVKLFMSEDTEPNAFATGRKTLCITRGLLYYSDEQILGVMGHEFGHLAHKDTDIILVVAVGNMIISALFIIIRVIANISMWIAEFFTAIFSDSLGGAIAHMFVGLSRIVANVLLALLIRLWTQLGVWLCMASSRQNEYRADEYSYQCGYADGLCDVLKSFGNSGKASGLFASLSSSHPDNAKRVSKLRELSAALPMQPQE